MKSKGIRLFVILLAILLFAVCFSALAKEQADPAVPNTGDRSYLAAAIAVLAVSALGIAAVIIIPRIRRKK